jgi:hypothetical protein
MSQYLVDLDQIRRDIILVVGNNEGITPSNPCFRCGATQPAHACLPQDKAKRRLAEFAGIDVHTQPRRWREP